MTTKVSEYFYDLPDDRIASYPLADRDESRLLVFRAGRITHEKFTTLANQLPERSMLVFNNTKVIPARLRFTKETGAIIEVFLLEPVYPSSLLSQVMEARGVCHWKCTVGNLKRWSAEKRLQLISGGFTLSATLIDRVENIVRFEWSDALTFAEVLDLLGKTPLPPYIKRNADHHDKERYQTVYSRFEGAVAAPTAGLHFTDRSLESLRAKNIPVDFVTLHVSAGTFMPIKVERAADHLMHREQVIVTRENIINLLSGLQVIAVGTTSMRTLESLYWFGVKLIEHGSTEFSIDQNDPYDSRETHTPIAESLNAVLDHMKKNKLDQITGETSIFIRPGYTFRVCRGLITNFHQPGSTLILLVAAFIGEAWKKVYAEALEKGYRFLSYGDSSLLLP